MGNSHQLSGTDHEFNFYFQISYSHVKFNDIINKIYNTFEVLTKVSRHFNWIKNEECVYVLDLTRERERERKYTHWKAILNDFIFVSIETITSFFQNMLWRIWIRVQRDRHK